MRNRLYHFSVCHLIHRIPDPPPTTHRREAEAKRAADLEAMRVADEAARVAAEEAARIAAEEAEEARIALEVRLRVFGRFGRRCE